MHVLCITSKSEMRVSFSLAVAYFDLQCCLLVWNLLSGVFQRKRKMFHLGDRIQNPSHQKLSTPDSFQKPARWHSSSDGQEKMIIV